MEKPHFTAEDGRKLMRDADGFVRNNPVPSVLSALAVGFALGWLVHALEPKDSYDELRDRVDSAEDHLRSLLDSLTKHSKKAYRKTSGAVREAVDHAADAAKEVDVEEYADHSGKWFKSFWKKCCG